MGKKFELEQIEGEPGHCRLGGNAVTQEENDICELHNDCDSGLECVKDAVEIENCQSMCRRRRYVQRMVDACVAGCDITTCEVKEER